MKFYLFCLTVTSWLIKYFLKAISEAKFKINNKIYKQQDNISGKIMLNFAENKNI